MGLGLIPTDRVEKSESIGQQTNIGPHAETFSYSYPKPLLRYSVRFAFTRVPNGSQHFLLKGKVFFSSDPIFPFFCV